MTHITISQRDWKKKTGSVNLKGRNWAQFLAATEASRAILWPTTVPHCSSPWDPSRASALGAGLWTKSLLLHAALQQQLTSGLCNLALYHNASTFIVKVIIIFRLLQTIQNVRFRRRRVTMFLQNKTGTLQMHWQNIIWQTSDKWNKHTTTNLNFGMEKWGSGEGWGAAVGVCIRGHKKINSTRQKYLLTLIIFLQVCTKA